MNQDTSDSFNNAHDENESRLEARARHLGELRASQYSPKQAVLIQAEYARLFIENGYEEDEANQIAERQTTLTPDPLTLDEDENMPREEKYKIIGMFYVALKKILSETADDEMDNDVGMEIERDRGWGLERDRDKDWGLER